MLISPGVFNPAVVSLRLELWREEERKLPMEWGAWAFGLFGKSQNNLKQIWDRNVEFRIEGANKK